MGAAIGPAVATEVTDHCAGITTLLAGNVFRYPGDLTHCCVLGFDAYDFEPGAGTRGSPERAFVLNYSSWPDPDQFGDSRDLADAAVPSHEMAEIVNDPFVATKKPAGATVRYHETPWWASGRQLPGRPRGR